MPADAQTAARLRRQRQRDTAPELALRRALHARGLRYFVDRAPLETHRRRADIVFPTQRVAVFADGCFWHDCPIHGTVPTNNHDWWVAKLRANVERDRDTDRALADAGWAVVRVWEHEAVATAATRVEAAVRSRRSQSDDRNAARDT